MREYNESDKKEVAKAFVTLVKLCSREKANKCSCTLQIGDLYLDCRFRFREANRDEC